MGVLTQQPEAEAVLRALPALDTASVAAVVGLPEDETLALLRELSVNGLVGMRGGMWVLTREGAEVVEDR